MLEQATVRGDLAAGGSVRETAGWQGSLELEVERRDGRSILSRSAHSGPLRVQRAFYPEGEGSCHVYVLHPPGGVVSGDRLALSVHAHADSAVLLTTPGATKLYRARAHGDRAQLTQCFQAEEGAAIEWLPQDTIAFDGSQTRIDTTVELAARAVYAGWEIVCLGRPAAKEQFTYGSLESRVRIRRAGVPCLLERAKYEGGDTVLTAPWGLRGQPVVGTFLIAAPNAVSAWVDAVREQLGETGPCFALTLVSGIVVARYIGASTLEARSLFERIFRLLRPYYLGREAVFPRIWRT